MNIKWIEEVHSLEAILMCGQTQILTISVATEYIDSKTREHVINFGIVPRFSPVPKMDCQKTFRSMNEAKKYAIAAYHTYLGYIWRVQT